jgi:predicted DNA-binding protein
MVKMTFTFDERTVETLRRTSARLKKPNSVVVREAIQDYAERADRLSDEERRHLVRVLDRVAARPATRTAAAVDREIRALRTARKSGGRSTRAE